MYIDKTWMDGKKGEFFSGFEASKRSKRSKQAGRLLAAGNPSTCFTPAFLVGSEGGMGESAVGFLVFVVRGGVVLIV